MTQDEEKTVKRVTNALLGQFAIGDDVRIVGITVEQWKHLNGSITKVVGIVTEPEFRYVVGITSPENSFYKGRCIDCSPRQLEKYVAKEIVP